MTKTPSDIIKELNTLGYSQTDIAKLSSVNQPTISRILHGGIKAPRWDVAASLAAVLEDVSRPKRRRSKTRAKGAV